MMFNSVQKPGMPSGLSLFSPLNISEFRRDMSSSCERCMPISVSASMVSVSTSSNAFFIPLLDNARFFVEIWAYSGRGLEAEGTEFRAPFGLVLHTAKGGSGHEGGGSEFRAPFGMVPHKARGGRSSMGVEAGSSELAADDDGELPPHPVGCALTTFNGGFLTLGDSGFAETSLPIMPACIKL
jgi:hypothetical protein